MKRYGSAARGIAMVVSAVALVMATAPVAIAGGTERLDGWAEAKRQSGADRSDDGWVVAYRSTSNSTSVRTEVPSAPLDAWAQASATGSGGRELQLALDGWAQAYTPGDAPATIVDEPSPYIDREVAVGAGLLAVLVLAGGGMLLLHRRRGTTPAL